MNGTAEEKIAECEAALAGDPESESLRARLVDLFTATAALRRDPRRFDHVRWLVKNVPRHRLCASPFVLDNAMPTEVVDDLRSIWSAHLSSFPSDPVVLENAAFFFAVENSEKAKILLRQAIDLSPEDHGLWISLGRMNSDPLERIACFERAIDLGSSFSNLPVFIAKDALKVHDFQKAESIADDLLARIARARQRYGDKLDWRSGKDFWPRARAEFGDDAAAREFVTISSDVVYLTHWGHTVKGLVAAERGDMAAALEHLKASVPLRFNYRVSIYGPSIELLRAVCSSGYWEEAETFLRLWNERDGDKRMDPWIEQVRRREMLDERLLPPCEDE